MFSSTYELVYSILNIFFVLKHLSIYLFFSLMFIFIGTIFVIQYRYILECIRFMRSQNWFKEKIITYLTEKYHNFIDNIKLYFNKIKILFTWAFWWKLENIIKAKQVKLIRYYKSNNYPTDFNSSIKFIKNSPKWCSNIYESLKDKFFCLAKEKLKFYYDFKKMYLTKDEIMYIFGIDFYVRLLHPSSAFFVYYDGYVFDGEQYIYYHNYYNKWRDFNMSTTDFVCSAPKFMPNYSSRTLFNRSNVTRFFKNTIPSKNIGLEMLLTTFYEFFKSILIPLVFSFMLFLYLIVYYQINIQRQLIIWAILGFLFFWLFSGFTFFLKRYKSAKFTSSILRFWKRTNVYFWLVEGFLFLLFFYYYLNSSQEPIYMYDYSSLNQNYLPNLINSYPNFCLLGIIIIYYFYWILNYSNFSSQQNLIHCLVITLYFVYTYFIESYQFYYTIGIFFENIWNYNFETNLWTLDFESPRLRNKQQYMLLALIAKYWHFIFIFLSWLFFILKVFEQKRAYYTHSGFNLQNLIILFFLNFLFIVQWFKWIARRFLDSVYYWFFTDSNFSFINFFTQELTILLICDVRH